jgi:HK97 family phage prohead protease
MKKELPVEKLLPIIEEKFDVKFENITGMVVRKSLETEQLAIDENDKDCVIAKLSSIDADRVGDVLIPEGCDLSDYERNSVVLVSHDYSKLPVAKMIKIQKTNNAVYGKMQFSQTVEAQEVLQLIREGILKTCSVGFVAKNTLKKGSKSFIEYIKTRLNGVENGVKQIITDWKMLELSLVSIPCNSEALVLAVSKGLTLSENTQKLLNIEEAFNKSVEIVPEITPEPQPVVEIAEKPEKPEKPVEVIPEPTISEQVEHITEEVKEVIKDVEKVVETVVEEVKPIVERFIRLVSKPEETIKKELEQELINKKRGKLS